MSNNTRQKKFSPLSANLSVISCSVASRLDTDFLIIPTQISVGTLVSDQSLTGGEVQRAGKFYREDQTQFHQLDALNRNTSASCPHLEEVDVVSASHVLQLLFPPRQLGYFPLQFCDKASGPPLRLPLLLLYRHHQFGLSPLDGPHQLGEDLRALLDLPLCTGLSTQRRVLAR